jgi:periplasmic mercuric ion binding protein
MKRTSILMFMVISLVLSLTRAEASKPKTETASYWVSVHCTSCQQKIMENIAFEKGVKAINVDIPSKKVDVTFDPKKTDKQKISKAIEKLGYEVRILQPGETLETPIAKACCTGGEAKKGDAKCCSSKKDGEHKCAGHASTSAGATTTDSVHKCAGQKDAAHTCAGQKDKAHKCSGQKDANHKCCSEKEGAHKCTGAKEGEHKCTGHKASETQKTGQDNSTHKCSGQKEGAGATTEPHKCTQGKK